MKAERTRPIRAALHLGAALAVLLGGAWAAGPASAQPRYDPGASGTEIRVGNTMPYSGPASTYGKAGKTSEAYFRMVNEQGGIRGRKIRFISLDDAYSPPKTVEATRRLVEADEVLLMFGQLGTATNAAIVKDLNAKGIPHLFMSTGASQFSDPAKAPWSMAFLPSYFVEGGIYAKDVLKSHPNAKIAVLYQNDDYGKDFLSGFKAGLGEAAGNIVSAQTYEATDPTVDSQVVAMKGSGATVLMDISLAKQAAQAIRKVAEIDWKPMHYLISTSSGISGTLTPAGLDRSVGIVTAAYSKDPRDPRWKDDPGLKAFAEFMRRYYPEGDPLDGVNVTAYNEAMLLARVLEACGNDLTRANVMRQAANLKDVELPMLLPGIKINTSPTDYRLIESMQLQRFDGTSYQPVGGLLGR